MPETYAGAGTPAAMFPHGRAGVGRNGNGWPFIECTLTGMRYLMIMTRQL
jgi:hypothetical protein